MLKRNLNILILSIVGFFSLCLPSVVLAEECLPDTNTRRITVRLDNEIVTFRVGFVIENGITRPILVINDGSNASCVFSDKPLNFLSEITSIIVESKSVDGDEGVVIDMINGPFAPGAPEESSPISEIEFEISLGAGSNTFTLKGNSATNVFDIGKPNGTQNYDGPTALPSGTTFSNTILLNLNHDSDADIVIKDALNTNISVRGKEGNDILNGRGGFGTGAAATIPLTLEGGAGDDTILAGTANKNILRGDDGNDTITGGIGIDVVYGGTGNDTVRGSSSTDALYGQDGLDNLGGGTGIDACWTGEPGRAAGDIASSITCELIGR